MLETIVSFVLLLSAYTTAVSDWPYCHQRARRKLESKQLVSTTAWQLLDECNIEQHTVTDLVGGYSLCKPLDALFCDL
eukprot:19169-Heterococcus_DN1.PRE.3